MTVVDVDFTVESRITKRTIAGVFTHSFLVTFSSVLARICSTLVDLLVTGWTCVASWTVADVPRHIIFAGTSLTRIVPTLVHVCLASLSVPTWLTATVIVVHLVHTLATIETRSILAFVYILFTESSSISRFALTPVRVDFINTFSIIEARVA